MKYKIIWFEDIGDLEFEVNQFLELNWEPKGGPFEKDGVFYQALVTNQDDPDFPRVDDVE